MVNGVFAAELALYLPLFPLVAYNFWTHRWSGFLGWYYLAAFCGLRIASGGVGVGHGDSLVASILIGIGTSPLILAVDGLVHEARTHRNPNPDPSTKGLGYGITLAISGLMGAAIGLTVTGAMAIYKNEAKPSSMTHWKAGAALMVVAWVLVVLWTAFSLLPSQAKRGGDAPMAREGTMLLYGLLISLVFIGIRVVYALVATATQRRDLSPVYGTTAVRVVLMFLPEAIATIVIVATGFMTRKKPIKYTTVEQDVIHA
ncbi:hypothetical protein BDV18DRAFT_41641 [Aspergillus unguis]